MLTPADHVPHGTPLRAAAWTTPQGRAERTDPPEVHQSGPRRLWTALERIRTLSNTQGSLPLLGARARITRDGVVHLSRGNWRASLGERARR
ncbi:hypothetical protein [Streptomyces sp. TE33382]